MAACDASGEQQRAAPPHSHRLPSSHPSLLCSSPRPLRLQGPPGKPRRATAAVGPPPPHIRLRRTEPALRPDLRRHHGAARGGRQVGGRGPAPAAALGIVPRLLAIPRALRGFAGGRGPGARLHRRPHRPRRVLCLPRPRLPLHRVVRRFLGVRQVLQVQAIC